MKIVIHPHAMLRMKERGTTHEEVLKTIEIGETFIAKFGRTGFRRNFIFNNEWNGKEYAVKQVEAYTAIDNNEIIVVTVITKYF